MNNEEKKIYTVKEVSVILCIGVSKAYELVRTNEIPNIKIGRRVIVPVKSLNEWIESRIEGVQ